MYIEISNEAKSFENAFKTHWHSASLNGCHNLNVVQQRQTRRKPKHRAKHKAWKSCFFARKWQRLNGHEKKGSRESGINTSIAIVPYRKCRFYFSGHDLREVKISEMTRWWFWKMWHQNIIEQRMQTICISFSPVLLTMRELLLQPNIRNMIANIALIWNYHSECSVSVCVCVYVCIACMAMEREREVNLHNHTNAQLLYLVMSRFVCLPRLFQHKTHQITENIYTLRYIGSGAVVSYIVVDVVVIWNFYRCWSRQSIEIEKKWRKKMSPKKTKKFSVYMKNINCYRGAMWPDPVFLFSYSIFDVLFFANRFMFTFHLFFLVYFLVHFISFFSSSSFIHSFVRSVVFLNFLISKQSHINSGDKDEVNRDRFAFCTWALILFVCDVCVIRKFPFSWDYSHFLFLFAYVCVCVSWFDPMHGKECACVSVFGVGIRRNADMCIAITVHMGISHRNPFRSESVSSSVSPSIQCLQSNPEFLCAWARRDLSCVTFHFIPCHAMPYHSIPFHTIPLDATLHADSIYSNRDSTHIWKMYSITFLWFDVFFEHLCIEMWNV